MSKRTRPLILPMLCTAAALVSATCTLAASAAETAVAPRARISSSVDDAQLITLRGNVRPEIGHATDHGAVADTLPIDHMQLLLQRSPEQEAALQRTIDSLHDPKSPNYHQWLSAEKFGAQYGVAQEDITTVTNWLRAHKFSVNNVYSSAMLIDFSGNAGMVREAFHTEIHSLLVNGARHIANMSDPQIPAALGPAIKGIVSLNDFRPHNMLKQKPKAQRPGFTTANGSYYVAPADLATIYNFNPIYSGGNTGQGQTIALIEDTDIYSAQDWSAFETLVTVSLNSIRGYGTNSSTANLLQLHPRGKGGANNCSDPGINSDDIEAIIDAEWASAAAPGAKIELVSCADTQVTFGGLIALQNLINASTPPPPIISMSYGECEAGLGTSGNAAYVSTFQQAVAEGVSVFVSSGDDGAASCDGGQNAAYNGISVSGFASTPYNVAVGGTDFSDYSSGTTSRYWNSGNSDSYGSALSYIPEIPWNGSCASSVLLQFEIRQGFNGTVAYGNGGFCNDPTTKQFALNNTVAGSGGPSNCASGSPSFDNSTGAIAGLGSCKGAAKPSWQTGVLGLPSDGVRDIPDLSLFASNGVWTHAYVVCYSDLANGGSPCTGKPDTWTALGGTSLAAPIMAGIQALINQKTGSAQGNPNYVYYKLAANQYGGSYNANCNSSKSGGPDSTCVFNDVTQGDNTVNCFGFDCFGYAGTISSPTYGILSTSSSSATPAFSTQPGWDFATGIGTVNVANLVNGWIAQ